MKEDLKDFKERKTKEIQEAYQEDLKQAKHRYKWLKKQAEDRYAFCLEYLEREISASTIRR